MKILKLKKITGYLMTVMGLVVAMSVVESLVMTAAGAVVFAVGAWMAGIYNFQPTDNRNKNFFIG